MKEKLTYNQQRALRNLAEGRVSSYGCKGQSEFGGHERVMWSLRRRGFVEDGEITDAGRAALSTVGAPTRTRGARAPKTPALSKRRHKFTGDKIQTCVCGITRKKQHDMGHTLHWFYFLDGRLTGMNALSCPGEPKGVVK